MIEITNETLIYLIQITENCKPNEAAAILFENNTIVIEMNPMSKSVAHFSDIDPIAVSKLIDEYGIPSTLFHSHPCAAIPSSTDLTYMYSTIAIWHSPWLIMSDKMKLRCWTIHRNHPIEIEVKIV